MSMPYRRLGRSGLKVSLLSFGSWISFANQLDDELAVGCLDAAREAGVNFFDNAESYAGGQSEAVMGRAFKTSVGSATSMSSRASSSGASTTSPT